MRLIADSVVIKIQPRTWLPVLKIKYLVIIKKVKMWSGEYEIDYLNSLKR